MRWIAELLNIVVSIHFIRRHRNISNQDSTARTTHANHLRQHNIWLQKMMESVTTQTNRKSSIGKLYCFYSSLLPGHINQVFMLRQNLGLFEHRWCDVNASN